MHLPDISEVDKELEELAKKKAKGQNLEKAESKIEEDSELDSEGKKEEAIAIGTRVVPENRVHRLLREK